LVDGGDLLEKIKRNLFFPSKYIKFIAAEILLIIEYLHSFGIIHRDLKANNVLISSNGHLKVID